VTFPGCKLRAKSMLIGGKEGMMVRKVIVRRVKVRKVKVGKVMVGKVMVRKVKVKKVMFCSWAWRG